MSLRPESAPLSYGFSMPSKFVESIENIQYCIKHNIYLSYPLFQIY